MKKYIVELKEAIGVTGQWEIWAFDATDAEKKAKTMHGEPPRDHVFRAYPVESSE